MKKQLHYTLNIISSSVRLKQYIFYKPLDKPDCYKDRVKINLAISFVKASFFIVHTQLWILLQNIFSSLVHESASQKKYKISEE